MVVMNKIIHPRALNLIQIDQGFYLLLISWVTEQASTISRCLGFLMYNMRSIIVSMRIK